MQLDAILEVAIGLVFIWLVISVATMEVQNWIGNLLNWRADFLEKSILAMFKDKSLVEKFYDHPLIRELTVKDRKGYPIVDRKTGKFKRPEYIPSPTFAKAAMEVIMNAGRDGRDIPPDAMSIAEMKNSLKALGEKNPPLAKMTHYLFPNAEKAAKKTEDMLADYRKNVENWFDDIMSQTSGWYKIRAQWFAFWIGLVIAVTFNMDTLHLAQKLWQEPTTRAVLVAQAQSTTEMPSSDALQQAQSLNIPIGWTTTPAQSQVCSALGLENYRLVIRSAGECRLLDSLPPTNDAWGLFIKAFGLLLSGAAAAQGAPFWFDILRKLVGLRQQEKKE